MRDNRGFTLIELILVIAFLGILFTMTNSFVNYKGQLLLNTTAYEVRNAMQLAQQLSIDETRSFSFEVVGRDYIVKENLVSGREVLKKEFPKEISVDPASNQRVSFNRNGVTNYSVFILKNNRGNGIKIETLIGTGRVLVTFTH